MPATRRHANPPDVPIAPAGGVAGRLWILAAAVLWSSSGLFAKAPIFEDWPAGERGPLLAFWRALFAGLLLAPLVRRPQWRWRMVPMTVSFTGMNATYLMAMTLTTAANAIWLQSTAPLWVFLLAWLLGQGGADRRDLVPLVAGMLGVGTILYFELARDAHLGIACGLVAGACYAGVVLSMRSLRAEDSTWLVVLNHLVAAGLLLPYVAYLGRWPSGTQLAVLAAFGLVQMGLPYVCFARGLRALTSQEAALVALCEPVLVPIWVLLAWGERPAPWTLAGGALIVGGLAWRYSQSTRGWRARNDG